MGIAVILQLLSSFKNILLKNWKIVVGLIIVVVACGYWFVLHTEINNDTAKIASLQRQVVIAGLRNTTCSNNNTKLQASIATQNTAISKLHQKYDSELKQQQQLVQQLKQDELSDAQALQSLKNEPVPKTCKSSISYMVTNAKELTKW